MLKRASLVVVSLALIAVVAVSAVRVILQRKAEPVYPIACADRSNLLALHSDRLGEYIAYVAAKHRSGVVLDKELVVSGIPDITGEIKGAIQSKAVPSPLNPKSDLPVAGFVDRRILYRQKLVDPLPPIGVIDRNRLVSLHPFYRRMEELNREEQAWKQGHYRMLSHYRIHSLANRSQADGLAGSFHYGMAETLVSPADVSRREKEEQQAMRAWEKDMREFTSSSVTLPGSARPAKPADDEKKLALVRAAMQEAYRQTMQAKMDELNQTFKDQAGLAESRTETALKAFADKLSQFRNEKLSAYRQDLSLESERRVKTHAAQLQDEFLQFEEGLLFLDQSKKLDLRLKLSVATPAEKKSLEEQLNALESHEENQRAQKQEALRRDLETYRDKELAEIAQALKSQAAALDQEAVKKIARYKGDLVLASREALRDEQESLRAESARFRAQTPEESRKKRGGRFAKDRATAGLMELAKEGKGLLEARMAGDRLRIEAKLKREENEILSRSKSFQAAARSIKKGNRKIIGDVISGLEGEKAELLKAIQEEISRQAETVAKGKGIAVVLTEVPVNVRAVDLTRDVAGKIASGYSP